MMGRFKQMGPRARDRDTMFQPLVPEMSTSQFGGYEDRWAVRDVVGHNGGDQGVATQMVFAPEASGSSY